MKASSIVSLFAAGLLTLSLGARAVELVEPSAKGPAAVPVAKPAADKPAAKPAAAKPAPKAAAKPAGKAAEKAGAPKEVAPEVITAMNKLVEVAIQRAGTDLEKGIDDFKPYGVMQLKSGELKTVQWNLPNPPPPLEMLRGIVMTLRKHSQSPDVVAAITVAPSAVPTKEGVQVRGIRCEVDHRDGAPHVVFIAYTREDGKLVLAKEPVYLSGTNPLFLRPGDETSSKATPTVAPATAPTAAKKP